MTKVTVDLETMVAIKPFGTSGVLSGWTSGIAVGTSRLEMTKMQKIAQGEVDGAMWYTVHCPSSEICGWIREQNSELWVQTVDADTSKGGYFLFNLYDIHEDLYSMLLLKFA
jgi:hypothetical protein